MTRRLAPPHVALAATLSLLVTLLLTVLPAGPAAAHTRTQETTNLASRITEAPELPGVSWTVHTGGLLIEVVNTGDTDLVVEGYEGEPYLRIGPDGVEHNRRSPATYLNDERIGRRVSARTDVAMPPDVDPDAPPEWVAVDPEPRALWHDHRVHWMSPAPPDFVEAGPLSRAMMRINLVGVIGEAGDRAGVFGDWAIPVSHGGRLHVVRGEMAWDDPPGATPWLLLAAALVTLGLLGWRRRTPDGVVTPAAVMVLAVAAANTIHFVDDLVAWPSHPLDELFGLLHSLLFLGLGIAGAWWSIRAEAGRVLALGLASAALLYHQGILHLPLLFASHFPTIWPPGLVRLTVALGVLQPVVVLLVVHRSRQVARLADDDAARYDEFITKR